MREIYPNQRIITIHKWTAPDGKWFAATKNAVARMNGKKASGFILWSLLRMDQDGFERAMSDSFFRMEYGMSADSYHTGWRILTESGFITRRSGHKYDFYEFPAEHLKTWETRFFDNDKNGETQFLKTGKPGFQRQGNPVFKTRETPREISNNSLSISNELEAAAESGADSQSDFQVDPEEARRIQNDHDEILNAAQYAGFKTNPATCDALIDLYTTYGKERILEGIQICVKRGKISPGYLEGCLTRDGKKTGFGYDDA